MGFEGTTRDGEALSCLGAETFRPYLEAVLALLLFVQDDCTHASRRLPEVSEELQEQLEITLNELGRLPPDVGDDPVTELLSLIRNFFRRIENIIDGSVASELCVVQSASDAYERFIKDIGSKTPRFRPVLKQNDRSAEFQEFPAALELDQLDTNTMTADILHLDDILRMAKRYALRSCFLCTGTD